MSAGRFSTHTHCNLAADSYFNLCKPFLLQILTANGKVSKLTSSMTENLMATVLKFGQQSALRCLVLASRDMPANASQVTINQKASPEQNCLRRIHKSWQSDLATSLRNDCLKKKIWCLMLWKLNWAWSFPRVNMGSFDNRTDCCSRGLDVH